MTLQVLKNITTQKFVISLASNFTFDISTYHLYSLTEIPDNIAR